MLMFQEVHMALFSVLIFVLAFFAAFAAIGSSVLRALPRIDAILMSRGQPIERTIRVGAPRNGWKLA
jgi:hypothetical protein